MKIKSIKGREILDSRGNPTVEVEVELECINIFCHLTPPYYSNIIADIFHI